MIRFWRQRSRVLSVVASPLIFWLLIGYGSNDLARFYSGTLVLTVMFSAIFSTITIIEDRREGFLLSMLVSPAPRTALVLGKLLGSATLAWIQGVRSEEHTSELQSHVNLVCRLLLEKKKK